jgi:hypothetical protein
MTYEGSWEAGPCMVGVTLAVALQSKLNTQEK